MVRFLAHPVHTCAYVAIYDIHRLEFKKKTLKNTLLTDWLTNCLVERCRNSHNHWYAWMLLKMRNWQSVVENFKYWWFEVEGCSFSRWRCSRQIRAASPPPCMDAEHAVAAIQWSECCRRRRTDGRRLYQQDNIYNWIECQSTVRTASTQSPHSNADAAWRLPSKPLSLK